MPFYIGDWRKDPGVQSLDYESKGIWFEILLFMWESERRGLLLLNGSKPDDADVANMLGLPLDKFKQTQAKLLSKGVASVEQNTGALMNRRMFYLNDLRSRVGKIGASKRLANASKASKQTLSPSSSISLSVSLKDKRLGAFAPPAQEEILAFMNDKNQAQDFYDYYCSNGWKIGGKAPMKDWKAAARRWQRHNQKPQTNGAPRIIRNWKCFVCDKEMLESERAAHMEVHTKERVSR